MTSDTATADTMRPANALKYAAALDGPVVAEVRDLLFDIYTPEEFGLWLALPHPQFGKSALDMILTGRGDEVINAATQIHDGVYS